MKNKIFIALLLLTFLALPYNKALAQEGTEATQAAQEEQSTKNLKTRIEKVVQEKREQIKGVIEKITLQKRGFIGEVQRISAESLTVKNSKGVEILAVDPDEVEILKNNKSINIDDIAIENWVVIMGLQDKDTFVVKRILVSDKSLSNKEYFVILGTVKSITSSKVNVDPRNDEQTISYKIGSSIDYQDLNGNEIENSQIEEESQALVVGYKTDDGNIATTIRSLAVIVQEDEE